MVTHSALSGGSSIVGVQALRGVEVGMCSCLSALVCILFRVVTGGCVRVRLRWDRRSKIISGSSVTYNLFVDWTVCEVLFEAPSDSGTGGLVLA